MEDQKPKPKRKKRISIRKAIELAEQCGRERVARGEPYWADKLGFKKGKAPRKVGGEWVQ